MLTLVFSGFGWWQWSASERKAISSEILQEDRAYRVFNASSDGPIIYSLDGQFMRNGLFPATLFSTSAFLRGRRLPKVVAVESTGSRDRDFRPLESTPTYWRPALAGRAGDFDRFLFDELIPDVEGDGADAAGRYIMGHSLAGLYVMDLASRDTGNFAGFFAFVPTFSHDTSIQERLPGACRANALIYANWGLESARDTEIFAQTVKGWKAKPECREHPPVTSRHYGLVHAAIMLTGHLHLAVIAPF